MNDIERPQGQGFPDPEASAGALQALGAGIAVTDTELRLLDADRRFLELHGIGDGVAAGGPGLPWPELIAAPDNSLPEAGRRTLIDGWFALARQREGRIHVRLGDGRVLTIACSSLGGERLGLSAMVSSSESAPAARHQRLLHDLSNAVGGLLANLHLALADLDPLHPARRWVEGADAGAKALRNRLRQPPPEE